MVTLLNLFLLHIAAAVHRVIMMLVLCYILFWTNKCNCVCYSTVFTARCCA